MVAAYLSVLSNCYCCLFILTLVLHLLKMSLYCLFAEPKASILGDSDVFMDVGSSLNLTCVVSNVNAMLKFIIWNHKNKVWGSGSCALHMSHHDIFNQKMLCAPTALHNYYSMGICFILSNHIFCFRRLITIPTREGFECRPTLETWTTLAAVWPFCQHSLRTAENTLANRQRRKLPASPFTSSMVRYSYS